MGNGVAWRSVWYKKWRGSGSSSLFNTLEHGGVTLLILKNLVEIRRLYSELRDQVIALPYILFLAPNIFLCSLKGISLWVISLCSFGALFSCWDKQNKCICSQIWRSNVLTPHYKEASLWIILCCGSKGSPGAKHSSSCWIASRGLPNLDLKDCIASWE